MADNLEARYYCLKLRTACLIIGYIGLIGYPIVTIVYAVVQIKYFGASVPDPSVKLFFTTAIYVLVVFMSGLMNMGIYMNYRNFIIKSLYFYLIFLFWCLIRILEGVIYLNIFQIIIFVIFLTWFVHAVFLVRAYLSFTSESPVDVIDREMKIASFGTLSDRREPFKVVHK